MKWPCGVSMMAVAAMMCLPVTPATARSAQSDLDELMGQVLQHRDENWKKLQQYVLDEREETALTGPGGGRLWGELREYTWYIRDGFFVRSPIRANGARVSEAERLKYEDEFLKRAKGRDAGARNGARGQGTGPANDGVVASSPGATSSSIEGILAQTRQPQFIDSAYFLRFKFEPGHYALVGRETVEKREVLRIEYYPERLFSHEQDAESRRRAERRADRKEDLEALTERSLNKVSLVTLWVDPSIRQIVKYTFDNVDLDFLPAAWLLRVDDLRATMNMVEPFPGVWLPAHVMVRVGLLTAAGPFALQYELDYHDYREPTAAGRFTVPGAPR